MSDRRDNILPDALQVPHLVAFDLLAKQRLEAIETDRVLVYLIDTVSESALYYLAEQFDLLGFKGWKLADTAQKKRDLIRNAIELHRYKGTLYSMRKALAALGYPSAIITEHVGGHWANFKIQLNIGSNTLSPELIGDINAVVMQYKNARSNLYGIEFEVSFSDGVNITDESYEAEVDAVDDEVVMNVGFQYNNTVPYDNSRNYSNDSDVLILIITP